tara:strand:- start:6408 stop:6914 length:507 start_codon:yes stop_codon:yes gene_type:complete
VSVTITPDEATGLTDITRPNFAMNQTVSASATATSPNVANVTNVTASVVGTQPDLVITSGTTSVNIGGTLQDPFLDQFTYVERGTDPSLYPKVPVTVTKVDNMPADKQLYNLNQDNTTPYIETFTVTVQWEEGPVGNLVAQTPATFTLELKINNAYEGIRSFISNYYT